MKAFPCLVIGAFLLLMTPGATAQEASKTPKPGRVEGTVTLNLKGVKLSSVAPVIAYLEGTGGKLKFKVPSGTLKISQKNARFHPSFMAITVGQTVQMPNDDSIVHNVFSYSKPNEFDLGLYRKGVYKKIQSADVETPRPRR